MLAVQLRQQRPIVRRCLGDGRTNAACTAAALAATTCSNGCWCGSTAGSTAVGRFVLLDRLRLQDGEAIVQGQLCGTVHVDFIDGLHDTVMCVQLRDGV